MQAQQDLFDTPLSHIEVDAGFSSARRQALDADSWIEVVTGWMGGAYLLLDQLARTVPWEQRDRRMFEQTVREPRLTGSYADVREVSEPALRQAAAALSARYGVAYDSLWLNFYRDGQDSTAWHRDRVWRRAIETVVPVLTLGCTRRFLLKPRAGGRSLVFNPSDGDLIVMGGRAQQDWVHCVPKDPGNSQRRISINFQSTRQDFGRVAAAPSAQTPGTTRRIVKPDRLGLDPYDECLDFGM